MGFDPSPFDAGDEAGFPPPRTSLGFDLDHGCTCQNDLRGGGPSCTAMALTCDGDGGVDNGFTALFSTFSAFGNADDLSSINQRIATGDSTFLISITDYNGLANDLEVYVTTALVTRPAAAPAPGCAVPDAGPRPVTEPVDGGVNNGSGPAWDGCDQWQVVRDTPVVRAYVANHQLIIDSAPSLPIVLGSATIDVRSPLFSGVLAPHADGSWSLEDAQFAARAPQDDLFGALLTFHIHSAEKAACFYPEYVSVFRSTFCGSLDIMASPLEDYAEAGLFACDSLSFAYAFRADPAVRGGAASEPQVSDCADSGAVLKCSH